MGEVPEEFCGYEWPEDCETSLSNFIFTPDIPRSPGQTMCIRETLPDASRCVWHAAPHETEHKSVQALRNTQVNAVISPGNKLGESLDGVVLAGMEIDYELDLNGALLRDSNLSEARLRDTDISGGSLFNADLSGADLIGTDLSEANLRGADLSGANLKDTDISEASLIGADLPGAFLWGADLSKTDFPGADLSEADLRSTNLSEADLGGVDLSEADLGRATLTGADLTDTKLSNLAVDRETTVDGLAEPEPPSPWSALPGRVESEKEDKSRLDGGAGPKDWDRTARAYHDLKTEFHDNGFVGKARRLHINERRSRRHETAVKEGWFSRQHLVQFVSGLFTGYGVGVWRLVATMTALFIISTVTYAAAGVTDPFTYSTITFATSPPKPTGTLPIWARFVANVETFLGTLLIVSLGFVLGNREQF